MSVHINEHAHIIYIYSYIYIAEISKNDNGQLSHWYSTLDIFNEFCCDLSLISLNYQY